MRRTRKSWLLVAAVLTLAGVLLFAIAFSALGFDFARISTQSYERNIYEVNGNFDHIQADIATAKITFAVSADSNCKIECFEPERWKHSATVQDGTLMIHRVDTRQWYDYLGVNLGHETVTVYLPRTEYDSLQVNSATGNVEIPKEFSFESVHITADTADVVCRASISDSAEFRTDTGSISLEGANSKGSVSVQTDTGRISLVDLRCKELSAKTDTGDILLKNVIAADTFFIDSDTGSVTLDHCDAGEITVQTEVGDITGTLLSDKIFYADSSVGDVDVPKAVTGGRCELTTDIGDIQIGVIH